MKFRKYTAIAIAALLTTMSSCRDDAPYVINPNEQNTFEDWSDVFESFWNAMNYSYVFWDVDPTDWDQVYVDYKPQFANLEFGVPADSVKAADLFKGMLANIIDHHYAFVLKKHDDRTYMVYRPAIDEVSRRDYYHDALDQQRLIDNMRQWERQGRVTDLAGRFNPDDGLVVYSCLIDGSVVYLRFNEFSLYENREDKNVAAALENYKELIKTTSDLKGIIIDTRSNGGGNTADEQFVLNPLLKEPHTFGYTRSKLGQGRLDYTPDSPLLLDPMGDNSPAATRDLSKIPIIGLLDIHSVSMAEVTQMAVQELPNGILIGERSWGGHGPLNGDINGLFTGELENKAFRMFTSTSMTRRLDGKCYEGIGIIPDIEVLYDETQFLQGNDIQLNRAIDYAKNGR